MSEMSKALKLYVSVIVINFAIYLRYLENLLIAYLKLH